MTYYTGPELMLPERRQPPCFATPAAVASAQIPKPGIPQEQGTHHGFAQNCCPRYACSRSCSPPGAATSRLPMLKGTYLDYRLLQLQTHEDMRQPHLVVCAASSLQGMVGLYRCKDEGLDLLNLEVHLV